MNAHRSPALVLLLALLIGSLSLGVETPGDVREAPPAVARIDNCAIYIKLGGNYSDLPLKCNFARGPTL